MIEEIKIKDFAIIDRFSVSLSEGFNVITGETGAGKSIIVDALSVLLKEKVSPSDYVRHGSSEATVEAVITQVEHEYGDDVLILRKILNLQGKTRAYINDSAHTLQGFSAVASRFINIHGQHEHTALLKKESHIEFFDNLIGLRTDVNSFNSLYSKYLHLMEEVENTESQIKEKKQKAELLAFQIEEIEKANLSIDEEKELIEKRQILRNALKIKEIAESAFELIYREKNSVYTNLSKVLIQIKELVKFDSKAKDLMNIIDTAFAQIEEAVYLLRKLKEGYEPDPHLLEQIEERLTLINRLKSKYGGGIDEVLKYCEHAKEELKYIAFSEEELQGKKEQLIALWRQLTELAGKISKNRKQKKREIEEKIIDELKFLGFSNPIFEIQINEKPLGENGIDDVEFYFSANPDQPPKPLNKVVSGGELSRLMLAIKSVEIQYLRSNSQQSKPLKQLTLVFDEIDAGIGGKVAENVGRKLKQLATFHQVLCVTHLPQIAAMADYHLKVEKTVENGKTKVKIKPLSEDEKKEEIARMLSGRVTSSSLKHAEELLGSKT